MSHKFWLEELTRTHEIYIGAKRFLVNDFYTSESVPQVKKEIQDDIHKLLLRDLPPRSIILDIGANVGLWSMYAAILFPDCKIVAIEPMPHNYKNLVQNIEMNGFKDRIITMPCAVSGKDGNIMLKQHPLNSGSASEEYNHEDYPEFAVPSYSLDTILDGYRAAFIKMDIEGSEYEVLYNTKVWDKIDFLSVELHNLYLDADLSRSTERKNKLAEFLKEKMGDRVNLVFPGVETS